MRLGCLFEGLVHGRRSCGEEITNDRFGDVQIRRISDDVDYDALYGAP
jgi:hypothetical protein